MRPAFLVFLFLTACLQVPRYQIVESSVDSSADLLKEVNLALTDNPDDRELAFKKLYISRELKWPEDVSKELTFLINSYGLTPELYVLANEFYAANNNYEKLLRLTQQWESDHQGTSEELKNKVLALNGLGRTREASELLWNILQQSEDTVMLAFVANQYLTRQDTARSAYAFSRLAGMAPGSRTVFTRYIPLLLQQGYPDRAKQILKAYPWDLSTPEDKFRLAQILFQINEEERAIGLMRSFETMESYQQLSNWYLANQKWDSALVFANLVIEEDSTNSTLFHRARIYENRGWLNTAYELYQEIVDLDTSDQIAREQAELVSRKIAYLQRLREAEEQIPILEITPKKSTENE